MKPAIKKVLLGVLAIVSVGAISVGTYARIQTSAFDDSMNKVYDAPLPVIVRSTDAQILARGKHVTEALGACSSSLCHGADLGGGKPIVMGPVATLVGPNITGSGMGAAYSDAELARLLHRGIKKDGRSVRFMPVQDFSWLPDSDVAAAISYLRTVPDVVRSNPATEVKPLGKVLDRRGQLVMDVARRITSDAPTNVPGPSATPEYGAFVARLCTGCHGENLSGGAIPGAPPSVPIPSNLTPDASGLKDWSYQDFDRLLTTGVRKNGKPLNPFMPIESFGKFDEIEKKALWVSLQGRTALPFGGR